VQVEVPIILYYSDMAPILDDGSGWFNYSVYFSRYAFRW